MGDLMEPATSSLRHRHGYLRLFGGSVTWAGKTPVFWPRSRSIKMRVCCGGPKEPLVQS